MKYNYLKFIFFSKDPVSIFIFYMYSLNNSILLCQMPYILDVH